MLFARAQLRDSIDSTDPCTQNPNDPICKLTASDVAADPCTQNPNAPYCQQGIVAQTQAQTPDPSQWAPFVNSAASAQGAPLAPAVGPSAPGAASLAMLGKIPWGGLLLIGLGLGLGAFAISNYRKRPTSS